MMEIHEAVEKCLKYADSTESMGWMFVIWIIYLVWYEEYYKPRK